MLGAKHVDGLAERDVELVVRADAADARRVVVGFLRRRDQVALLDDHEGGDVRSLVEELGGREHQHAVLLGEEQEAVLGEADAVRHRELDRRRELAHVVGDAVLVAVGDRIDLALARAHEGDDALRSDRHVARVRHDGVEADLETVRQLDAGESLLDRLGLRPGLGDLRHLRRAGGLEFPQLFEISGARRLGERRADSKRKGGDSRRRTLHGFPP